VGEEKRERERASQKEKWREGGEGERIERNRESV
jgi:hypothetical protein